MDEEQREFAETFRAIGQGTDNPDERLPVYQGDRKVGTLPAGFNPMRIRSTSIMYDARPGDFRRDGNRWIADKMLGCGDLDAVPGFVWERDDRLTGGDRG